MTSPNDMRMAAAGYARRGWAVFPVEPDGKDPATRHGFKDAVTDPATVEAVWLDHPRCNIGIATGAMSGGVFVIDVDNHNGIDGAAYLMEWEREHGKFPETACATTGSGGTHYFFRAPSGVSVRSAAHVIEGVDVRGDGGYIVAPPSRHPNGNLYEWDLSPEDYGIAEANESVLALVRNNGAQEYVRFQLPEVIPEGTRVQTLFKYASSRQSHGDPDDVLIATISDANKARCIPPLPDDVLWNNVLSGVLAKFDKGNAKPQSKAPTTDIQLMKTANGSVRQTIENALRVLNGDPALSGRFWWNELTYTRMVALPVPWDDGAGSRAVRDEDYAACCAYMEKWYLVSNKQKVIDAIQVDSLEHRSDPVVEWLDSLEWDGEHRVRDLPALLDCEDNEYNETVMWLTMLGAVYRAYEPGCKMDYMTVLVGEQGIGKSQFVRLLAHNPEWTTDNFNTISGDEAVEKIRGMWIAEMAELLATKRAKDVEAIKAFISCRTDVIRPKYGRETVQRPRRCIFIGTTNDSHFLTDTTGNRRFLPIECRQKANVVDPMLFDPEMPAYIEQAWAEVVHRYKTEHPVLRLPPHLEAKANEMREAYTEEQPLVGIIGEYLEHRANGVLEGSVEERVCTREIIERCLGDEWRRFDPIKLQNMVADTLDKMEKWKREPKKQRTSRYGIQKVWIPIRQKQEKV